MPIKVKAQRDYLLTEASVELCADVSQVDELLRAAKTNGKMVVLYNGGAVQGINIEQRSKISDAKSADIRKILEIEDKVL